MNMRRTAGYTLLELVVSISLLAALTGIALVSLHQPQALLQRETVIAQAVSQLKLAGYQALMRGKPVQLSWTPWTLWKGEAKVMDFPPNGPWQWQSAAAKVILHPNGSVETIDQRGLLMPSLQPIYLLYQHKMALGIRFQPFLTPRGFFEPFKSEPFKQTRKDNPPDARPLQTG